MPVVAVGMMKEDATHSHGKHNSDSERESTQIPVPKSLPGSMVVRVWGQSQQQNSLSLAESFSPRMSSLYS